MALIKFFLAAATLLCSLQTATAQVASSDVDAQLKKALEQIERLATQVAAQDARIRELEAARPGLQPATPVASVAAPTIPAAPDAEPAPRSAAVSAETAPLQDTAMAGHNMSIPGGPVLNIRGFFDFNFGVGSIANPLVYPIIDGGCGPCGNPPTPPHSTFQAGEFDLADLADLDAVELHGSFHNQTGGILHIAVQVGLGFEDFPSAACQKPRQYQNDERGSHEDKEDSGNGDRLRLDLDV